MRRVIAFFVDRSLLVNLITVFVCFFGVIVATGVTRALLPSGSPSRVHVVAQLPGASALDMERFVTFRIEEALYGIAGVDEMLSTTQNSQTAVTIKLKPEFDVTKALEETRSRLSAIRHRLPKDLRPLRIEEPQIEEPVLEILIENVDETNLEHRRAIEAYSERLRRIPNVLVVKSSMRDMNLYIRFSRKALEDAGLSVTVARQRILEFLAHMPVGSMRVKDQEVIIELHKPLDELDDIENLPLVVNRVGQGILLSEVAQVERGFPDEDQRRLLNGKSYVGLDVEASRGSDTISLSKAIRDIVEQESKKILPEPLTARVSQDVSELVAHEIDTLQSNGLGGIVLVLIILMIFLGWRVSAMTALGLPFCYLGMILVMNALDINFNFVSLVAMILVVGILVDDAIIVAEEFCQRLDKGDAPREAAIAAVGQVGKPILGMAATTAVAFTPLILMKSQAAWMLFPLPIVIITALGLSLFESFFILPNHLRHLIKPGYQIPERRFVLLLRNLYGRVLSLVLKLRYVSLVVVVGLFVLAIVLLQGPVEFRGNLSLTGRADLNIELDKAVDSLDQLQERVRPIEALVAELPEEMVDNYRTVLGHNYTPNFKDVYGWKYVRIAIFPRGTFVEQEEKRHQIAEVLSAKLAQMEGKDGFARLRFRESSGGDTRDIVSIYVSGGDRINFTDMQQQIRTTVRDVEDVKDVFMDDTRFQRALRFVIDEKKSLSYDLSTSNIHAQLREHFSGQELARIRHKGEEIEVFLGFTGELNKSVEELNTLTIITPRTTAVPLSMLGRWEEVEILRRIEHKDTLRTFQVDVLYDEEKTDAEKVAEAIEAKLETVREKYPSYHVSVKPSEKEAETKAWAIRLALVCVGLIYLCLALSLNSLVQPIVVIFAIPFGFVGVVLAFWVHGMPLGVMAMIGILGLAGVVVNDSLVMATAINDAREKDFRSAIQEGAKSRFRAVVLTSLTTMGGVFPLAYGVAGSAGWLQPMVLAVGWGLLFATLLTLFFVPCLLLIIDDVRRVARRVGVRLRLLKT